MSGKYGQLKIPLDYLADLLSLPDNAKILGAKQMEDDFDGRTFTLLIDCPDFPHLEDGQDPTELSPTVVTEDSKTLVAWTQGDEAGYGVLLSSKAQLPLKARVYRLSRFIVQRDGDMAVGGEIETGATAEAVIQPAPLGEQDPK